MFVLPTKKNNPPHWSKTFEGDFFANSTNVIVRLSPKGTDVIVRLSPKSTDVILGCPANEFVVLNYKDLHCTIPELCLEKKNRPLRRFATPPLTLGRKVINTLLCRSLGEHFSFLPEVRGGARRAEGSVSKG